MNPTAEFITSGPITLAYDDIFAQDVDAIVNPANTHMLHGGGLAAAIARRAGNRVVGASREQAPIDTGGAIWTGAGELAQFKGIIHAVGPMYNADERVAFWRQTRVAEPTTQDRLLASAYSNAVALAWAHDCTSLAFPAISCGVFHYPVREAAPVAIEALREAHSTCPGVKRSIICVLEDEHWNAFKEALDG